MEAIMFEDGDDAAHCANGLTANRFREATPEERVIYRRWMRGMGAFYAAFVLFCGLVAAVSYSSSSPTQLTNLSTHSATTSLRAD
jgi:hypothetical protein